MFKVNHSILSAACGAALCVATTSGASAEQEITASGDVRLRFESDWSSITAAEVARNDRHRLRVRTRAGLTFKNDDQLEFGLRLRSGSDAAQQGAHITILDFSDNPTGGADFNFDQWYVAAKAGPVSGWAGRNNFPFWQQNEMLWDNDTTITGAATKFSTQGEGATKFTLHSGYFGLPVGLKKFSGEMFAAQAVVESKLDEVGLVAAAGLFAISADGSDPDIGSLLEGNGARDYTIAVGNLQAKTNVGGRPLTFGADLFLNLEDYDTSADPFTVANADETTGYTLSVMYGGTKKANDWLLGYSYARIEQFAVNNSYAQDDWVRFGAGGQTRASNIKGHELRAGYAFTDNVNVLTRLYLVDAITTKEKGNRLRVDLNIKF